MNAWIIAGIVAGLLLVGVATMNIVNADLEQENSETFSCSTCGNSCTAENNCGLASCGAVNGRSCGCGR